MPRNWYFTLGDLFSNALCGLLAALSCFYLFDTSWSMFIAMILAMLLGMAVAMLAALLFLMRFFGAMEIMLPTMVTGMVASMIVGMRATMAELSQMDACLYGMISGLAVTGFCWAANEHIQRQPGHD